MTSKARLKDSCGSLNGEGERGGGVGGCRKMSGNSKCERRMRSRWDEFCMPPSLPVPVCRVCELGWRDENMAVREREGIAGQCHR